MELKSKNEFASDPEGGPSPRSNKVEESKGMKIIPMNYSEKE